MKRGIIGCSPVKLDVEARNSHLESMQIIQVMERIGPQRRYGGKCPQQLSQCFRDVLLCAFGIDGNVHVFLWIA